MVGLGIQVLPADQVFWYCAGGEPLAWFVESKNDPAVMVHGG